MPTLTWCFGSQGGEGAELLVLSSVLPQQVLLGRSAVGAAVLQSQLVLFYSLNSMDYFFRSRLRSGSQVH